MRAVEGRRAHFTHLQFHAYDAAPDGARRSGARQLIEYINAHPEVSGDVGQVMFGPATTLTADAAGRVPAAQEQRPQVGERRHRARDRLRHRALHLQGEARRVGAAVGGRARAVPAVGRSVASRALDRSSQRRLVPGLPRADPAADGSHLSRRAAGAREPDAARRQRAGRRPGARVHAATRSRSSRARDRRGCSA